MQGRWKMNCPERLFQHVRVLSQDIGSRSVYEPGKLEDAAFYIESELQSIGLRVLREEYSARGTRTANLVARSPNWTGDGPVLVLGAHYDTVKGTPGADDNASSIAVLIETARHVVEETPGSGGSLIFVAFSTEEPPCFNTRLMGSRIFVRRMRKSEIELGGALVLEMVGYFSDKPGSQDIPQGLEFLDLPDVGNFIALAGDRQSADLGEWVHRRFEESGSGLPALKLVEPMEHTVLGDLIRLSDNASFWDAGIPALMVTDTAFLRNRNYHLKTDTAETLDYGAMKRLVQALAYTLTF